MDVLYAQEIKMPDIASTTTLAADTVNLWD